jgi:hypothetical protein
MEARSEHPGLLHELELAFDVGAQAHEDQSGVLQAGVRQIAALLLTAGTADAQNAVAVDDAHLLVDLRLQPRVDVRHELAVESLLRTAHEAVARIG